MSYRTLAGRIEDGPEPLPKGPALKCAACGIAAVVGMRRAVNPIGPDREVPVGRADVSPLPMPRSCRPGARVRVGWFCRCTEPGEHLHERCKACGHEWLTGFAGGA